jgi:hypothetical protein
MNEPVVTVRSSGDVRQLLRRRVDWNRAGVRVRSSGVPAAELLRWEIGLNDALRECGCALGAKASLISIGVCFALQLTHLTWSAWDWLWFALRTIVVVFVAGGAGKMLGLALARARIMKIVAEMRLIERGSSEERTYVDMHEVG